MTPDQILDKAIRLHQAGKLKEAKDLYSKVLAKRQDDVTSIHHLGLIAYSNGDLDSAAELIGKALSIVENFPEALNNLGNVRKDQGRPEEAVASYRKAIALRPLNPEAHSNLGIALTILKRFDEAEACYREAIRQRPDYAEAYYNLGNVLSDQGRFSESAQAYRDAIRLRSPFPEAQNNMGNVLKEQGKLEESEACYVEALRARPDFREAYNNLGITYVKQGKYPQAIEAFQQALRLNPAYPEAHYNLGCAFQDEVRREEAVAAFQEALRYSPDYFEALSSLVYQRRNLCDWTDEKRNEERLREVVRKGLGRVSPFAFLVSDTTSEEQYICARKWAAGLEVPAAERMPQRAPGDHGGPIRIGYLSADFHQHATAFLMAELFERHDRSRFHITGYSYGPDDGSETRARLIRGFDRFVDVRTTPHADVARRIHGDGIDILIDLKGYTQHARTEIMAYRAAPIQVNYLGFPGTSGADFMDYIVVDPFIVPMDRQPYYSERIVHLPNCYQPNDTRRVIAEQTPTRAECGLPEDGFVFCSFNGPYKITPAFFAIWMRLLKEIPGSVLWLLETNAPVKANLRRAAAEHGVAPERLVFSPMMPLPVHLARHRLADLFLDTLPVNAHTTASDALWAGLPVLTLAGEAFVGRVAGSLVRAAGLPELVTHSHEEYEALALRLARAPGELAALRRRLADNRLATPLFDIERYTRNLEAAFARMWGIWCSGAAPQSFAVSEDGTPSAVQPPRPAPPTRPAAPAAPAAAAAVEPEAPLRIPYQSCPLCGGTEFPPVLQADCSWQPLYTTSIPKTMTWCQCASCGHVFTDGYLAPKTAALLRAPNAVQTLTQDLEPLRRMAARTVERVARLVDGGGWLDVGVSSASLLLTAAEWGYIPVGLDPDESVVSALRELGCEAHQGDTAALDQPGRFSVLSVINGLERLADPAAGLRDYHRLLRRDGVLLLSLPNMGSAVWQLADQRQENPYWAEIGNHHNFSRARLYALLEKHGFTPADYAVNERFRFSMEVLAVRKD